jgi:hypothetical protein
VLNVEEYARRGVFSPHAVTFPAQAARRDTATRNPLPRLVSFWLVSETCALHGMLETRLCMKVGGHNSQVRIVRSRSDRDVGVAGININGLSTDEHERLPVLL